MPPRCLAQLYHSIAALPAGRIAAAGFERIDVLTLEAPGSELAPAGDACSFKCVGNKALLDCGAIAECAARLDNAGPDECALHWHAQGAKRDKQCLKSSTHQ